MPLYATKYQKKTKKLVTKENLKVEQPIKKNLSRKTILYKPIPTITLMNKLDKDKITYQKHWYKPVPTMCSVIINNYPLLSTGQDGTFIIAKQIQLPNNEKQLNVTFKWKIEKFGKVWHHEEKEMVYELNQPAKEYILDFDWELKERLKISHAKLISYKELVK